MYYDNVLFYILCTNYSYKGINKARKTQRVTSPSIPHLGQGSCRQMSDCNVASVQLE